MPSNHFLHLENRCNSLIQRFLDPAIMSEQAALAAGQPAPVPNFDDFAAFRLLTHAELEGYFEAKATDHLTDLEAVLKGNRPLTAEFAALIFLWLWKEKRQPIWPVNQGDIKQLSQEALGKV